MADAGDLRRHGIAAQRLLTDCQSLYLLLTKVTRFFHLIFRKKYRSDRR